VSKSKVNKSKPNKTTAAVAHIQKSRKGNKRRNACIEMAGGDDLMFADGLDEAILGVAERDGTNVVVYDIQRIVEILRKRDGMSTEDAEEFFDFNIARAYFGSCTPMYLSKI